MRIWDSNLNDFLTISRSERKNILQYLGKTISEEKLAESKLRHAPFHPIHYYCQLCCYFGLLIIGDQSLESLVAWLSPFAFSADCSLLCRLLSPPPPPWPTYGYLLTCRVLHLNHSSSEKCPSICFITIVQFVCLSFSDKLEPIDCHKNTCLSAACCRIISSCCGTD